MRKFIAVQLFLAIILISCAHKETTAPLLLLKPARIAVVLGAGHPKVSPISAFSKCLRPTRFRFIWLWEQVRKLRREPYAYGYKAYQLQEISLAIEKSHVADLSFPDNGFIKGEKLESYINYMIGNTPMEKLRIPFYAVATDLRTGSEIVFGTGNTGTAVRASCSIPGIFRPVSINGNTYVDGGVVSPVAVNAARRYGADVVIAIDISAGLDGNSPSSTIETILQSIDIMYSNISSSQITKADIVIRPRVGYIGAADFDRRHEAILEGEGGY